ncbi:hypothetical protein MKW98_007802 [Papaver atlanticum]|uniref:Uncharacterized protein n=1 Tax=Papaver atlanticum TaxID=357466 RepID=A0AAD4RXS0_9MAGN|nr:hypothetical protein MKW98_007802 [Papaver atlanticum]
MKLSFSLNSKSNPKPRYNLEEEKSSDTKREYITEFDPTKPIDDDKRPKIIIPPLENSWKCTNKMKNLESLTKASATDDPESRFEAAAPTTAEVGDQGFKYGLTLRKKEDDVQEDVVMVDANGGSIESLMLNKFKEDMEKLPEDRGINEFIDCPVEGYGEALLAGYG